MKYISFFIKFNNYYYIDEFWNKILSNEKFMFYVFDINFYKEIEVLSEENFIFENFINILINDNYMDDKIDVKEFFRLKVVFKDDKYFIKVFNDFVVFICLWDGNYKEDIVFIKNLFLRYNLYDFCKYI